MSGFASGFLMGVVAGFVVYLVFAIVAIWWSERP